ncbi:MAG: hypothetical protein GX580_08350 [Candidatus Hydrogenedens sp.]|nr:hypothetical protein [Candidatus Hydrogenedens sp.]
MLKLLLVRGALLFGLLVVMTLLFFGWRLARNGWVGVDTDFGKSALLKTPPAALTEPVEVRLVTFNIQALWVVGRDRPARMRAIAGRLAELDPDVVGFQEAFVPADRELLVSELKRLTRLQHHQYYPSANVGSGVMISSAWPLEEVWFHRYAAHAPAYRFWEGDGLAGKGIGLARIALPGGGVMDFFNTHAQAGYGNPAYKLVRAEQMREAAAFIREAGTGTGPAFFVGDMNCRAGEPEYDRLVEELSLERAMAIPSRIDHIFWVPQPRYRIETLETVTLDDKFTEKGRQVQLSDHPGYFSRVRIIPN